MTVVEKSNPNKNMQHTEATSKLKSAFVNGSGRYFYLASPYSKYKFGFNAAAKIAAINAAILLREKIIVFSPIAMSHPIAVEGNFDGTDLNIWDDVNFPFMLYAYGMIILKAEGWEHSVGIEGERQYFLNAKKPIYEMDPGIVPDDLLKTRRIRR